LNPSGKTFGLFPLECLSIVHGTHHVHFRPAQSLPFNYRTKATRPAPSNDVIDGKRADGPRIQIPAFQSLLIETVRSIPPGFLIPAFGPTQ
jgi:hypothetical protein